MRLLIFILLFSLQASGQSFIFPAVLNTSTPPVPPTAGVRTLIYEPFNGSSLSSDWYVRRPDKQTISVSGGYARIIGNTDTMPQIPGYLYSNTTSQTRIYDTAYKLSMTRNYTVEVGFYINKLNDTTIGVYCGPYSPYLFADRGFSNYAHINFSNPDTLRYLGNSDTSFTFPPSGDKTTGLPAFNLTDYYVLRIIVNENNRYSTIVNRTTGDSATLSGTFEFTHGTWPARPNYFYFAFGVMGRTDVSFDYFHVYTSEEINPQQIHIGNSITTGYNAGSADSAWANMLKRYTTDSIQIMAGGGLGVNEIMSAVGDIFRTAPQTSAPKYAFLNIGTNDTYNPTNTAVYERLVDTLELNGFTVFPELTVNGGNPDSGGGWNQFIKTTYPTSYIDLWTTGWNTMTIGNGEMYDTFHPTVTGVRKIMGIIKSAKPLLFPL